MKFSKSNFSYYYMINFDIFDNFGYIIINFDKFLKLIQKNTLKKKNII